MSQTRKTRAIEKIEKEKKAKLMKNVWAAVAAVAVIAIVAIVAVSISNNKPIPEEQYPVVSMEIEGYGTVEMTLDPNKAPNTVKNMISLVESEFYDGQKILRVSKNFVIQLGSPDGTLSGGPGYTIPGEFELNGFSKNDIKHEAGVLSMARTNDFDGAGSQFFICTGTASHLDGSYAAFGKVTKGMDIIMQINEVEHDNSIQAGGGVPVDDIIITSMTVDTKGISYGDPKVYLDE